MKLHTRSSLAALALLGGLLFEGRLRAQHLRPLIPEPACTRVTLIARVGTTENPRAVSLRVENNDPGDFPARLHPEVEVEREEGGAWRRVNVAGMLLRVSCVSSPSDCVTIPPREALDVAPWMGMFGDGQCLCTRCTPAPAGRYRFVVHTCQHCQSPTTATSAPFTLPTEPSPRRRAPGHATSGRVMP